MKQLEEAKADCFVPRNDEAVCESKYKRHSGEGILTCALPLLNLKYNKDEVL